MKVNIEKEKEESIYQASLDEFSNKSFIEASTNKIVKNSNISKGSLFNYFKTKGDLFLYVFERSIKTIENEIFTEVKAISLSRDFFERIEQIQKIKMMITSKYSRESKIVFEAYKVKEEKIQDQMKEAYDRNEIIAEKLYLDNIDTSKLKDNIDIKTLYKTVLYISYGFMDELSRKYTSTSKMYKDIEVIRKELTDILQMIKENVSK